VSGRISGATERALALIGTPRPQGGVWSARAAAIECGIAESTIFRALRRREPPEMIDRIEARLKAAGIPYVRRGRQILAG